MPMSDKEQMQEVKALVKEYGYYILFSVIVFLVAVFGWRYWQRYQYTNLEHATTIYTQMLEASSKQKDEEVVLFGEQLVKNYTKSIYASFAALILAKKHIESKKFDLADERLAFVMKKSPSKKLRELARIRRARLLNFVKKPQEALDLLTEENDGDIYAALASEVRGDALSQLGKTKEAKEAYQNAGALSQSGSLKQPPLLNMKMQQF